ncbi:MAG TPA: hypothetical protein VF200_13385, partial [Woeseiaceae bacterium]
MAFLRGSRYGAELAKNANNMRFPPDLEREYHLFYLDERCSHVRSFNTIMCGLVALAIAACLVADRTDLVEHLRLLGVGSVYALLV